MLFSDSHTHSVFSFDGHDGIPDLLNAAEKAGLASIAVTDHCDIDCELKGFYPPLDRTARAKAIEEAKKTGSPVELCSGIELGQPHLCPDEAKRILSEGKYDFVLGSVHNLEGVPDFFMLDYGKIPMPEINDLYARAIEDMCKVAAFPGINSIAHITYPCRYAAGYGIKIDFTPFYDRFKVLFEVMKSNGVALELNVSGLRKGGDIMPTADILKLYRESGGEYVTCGSDAHTAADIGKNIADGYGILRDCGFGWVLRPTSKGLVPEKLV